MNWRANYFIDHPLRRLVHSPATLFGPYLSAGMTVLDVGCAMGVFTIPLARMVGPRGRVIAVDIQRESLDVLARRARRKGLADRIETRLVSPGDLGVAEPVEFALAFWMAHETPDPEALLRQVRRCLKPDGRFMLIEPVLHVSREQFSLMVASARAAGLEPRDEPRVRFSHACVFAPQ
jgi:ubiquinone/menaquinone biosynthesis C-methylase UbiE